MKTHIQRLIAVGLMVGASSGCGDTPANVGNAPTVAAAPVVAPADPPSTNAAPPVEAAPAEPQPAKPASVQPTPPGSASLPNDIGGAATARALAPSGPLPPEILRTTSPRPRISALDQGEVPLKPVAIVVPPLPLGKSAVPKPSPAPERVPTTLGKDSEENLTAVKLAERPVRPPSPKPPTLSAAADLPRLANQLPDRASLDDPTAEIATARAVITAMPVPDPVAWFMKFGIPDPFEFAEQLKGKLPIERELGTTPAAVQLGKP